MSRPIVQELEQYLTNQKLWPALDEAVKKALSYGIPEFEILGIRDLKSFIKYVNDLLEWVPSEDLEGKDVYYRLVVFYFIFNQPPFEREQTPINPASTDKPLSFFSKWLVRYAQAVGNFMDQPGSLTVESLVTFRMAKNYNLNEYIEPRGGWKTFNEFFARNFKPGYRPIDSLCDPKIIVSAADSHFDGAWPIESDSCVSLKGLTWSVKELLAPSQYRDQFEGGIFMHAFLNTYNYHRQHAPVQGKVLEAMNIEGQAYLETRLTSENDGPPKLIAHRNVDAPDNPGYQFLQQRGLIMLDSPIGLVAVLPIGMAQVSSVVITAEVGRKLRKGEELSYFQFGGSDIVLVFQRDSGVHITAKLNSPYAVGNQIATANPHPRA